jgi:hypothetical protein
MDFQTRLVGALLAAGALLATASCSTALEASFTIVTHAVETTSHSERVELHPDGDQLRMPADMTDGRLEWKGGSHPLRPGDEVELRRQDLDRAPGKIISAWINGRQIVRHEGYLRVMAVWRVVKEKALPAITWIRELSIEPGDTWEIDQTVMYSGAGHARLHKIVTRTSFTGPDKARFSFRPTAPIAGGRVVGVISTEKDDEP